MEETDRQINTCPQTCKHTVRKGIRPMKCVGWANCAKRHMPKRRRRQGEAAREQEEENKRVLELGHKDRERQEKG